MERYEGIYQSYCHNTYVTTELNFHIDHRTNFQKKKESMIQLSTSKIQWTCEVVDMKHKQVLAKFFRSNREHLLSGIPYSENVFTESENYSESLIKRVSSPNNFVLLIDNELIGLCGVKGLTTNTTVSEIGYLIDKRYEGLGIISTTVNMAIERVFNSDNNNTLEIHCMEKNLKSRAVPERLRFTIDHSKTYSESGDTVLVYVLTKQDTM
jgi:ribosomal-protein-serine acetyltransferase